MSGFLEKSRLCRDKKEQEDVVFRVFKIAFDQINFLQLMNSHLLGKYVEYDGYRFLVCESTLGVRQGLNFVLLAFLVYMNDLPLDVKCH